MKQAIIHFPLGITESVNAGTFVMWPLGGTSVETDAPQGFVFQRPFHQAGTLSELTVTVSANTRTADCTIRTVTGNAGGTNANMLVTFTSSQTGTLTDTSNTDDVADTEDYAFGISTAGGTGTITFSRGGCIWEPDTGAQTLMGCFSASSLGVANNGTIYLNVHGSRASSSDETIVKSIVTAAGTWRYLGIGGVNITVTTIDVDFQSRVNGVTGNQLVSFTETDDIVFFEDTSNSDTVAVGDILNYIVTTTNSTGGGGTNFEFICSQIDHSADESLLLVGGTRELITNNASAFFPVGGQTNSTATEANAQVPLPFAATASHFGMLRTQGTGGDAVGVLRINGSDGNCTATIDTSVSSIAVDTSNSDDIAEGDLLCLHITCPLSPNGNIRIQSTSLKLTAAAAGGSAVMTADSASYSLAGQTVSTAHDRVMIASAGSYVLTGQDVTTSVGGPPGFTMTADPASYALAGTDVTTLWDHVLPVTPGGYALTGAAATFAIGTVLPAASGSFILTGQDVTTFITVPGGIMMTAETRSYLLTGGDVTFSAPLWQNLPSNPTEIWYDP